MQDLVDNTDMATGDGKEKGEVPSVCKFVEQSIAIETWMMEELTDHLHMAPVTG
jgi:hypothetical protein